ncbi:sulfite exporter TauE/SafE family protein [Dongia deserti]|uniref:sulfite exporter TauE/SafE family protein n=1 Tax=Dongia deserti TaxID=2268030 RepID=UPI000E64DEF6|nr:sulfite exporter TauE/SafE family protein [Dongia deserti]
MDLSSAALLFAAGFGGGIAAAIAGGASLVTFPTLLAMGLPPVAANATNAVGLSLSNFMAALADWRRRPSWGRSLSWLFIINVIGGAIGAFLMLETPADLLVLLVPALIGGATLLFAVGPWVQGKLPGKGDNVLQAWRVALPLFLSAIYGGYFGAALGVINLAILSIGGLTDLRSTNVLKNILITGVSASSVWVYVWQGAVVWPAMMVLMAGSVGGGYAGGHLIRILPPRAVRLGIIAFGTAATAIYANKYWL